MKRLSKQSICIFLIAVFVIASGAALVSAAGFAVTEKSVKGLGSAFSGGAASAEDATTVYYNPAGMTRLTGRQAEVGISAIAYTFESTNRGSGTIIGQPLSGSDGGDAGMMKIIPISYYSQDISEKLKFGIGITAPFGMGTEYESGWIGRYHTIKSDILTIDVNPSIAYRIDERLSVGVGISAQYFDAELTNAVDFGTINAAMGVGLPLLPQGADGIATLTADDWAFGFNLGVLFEFSENIRFGLAYRSKLAYELEGEANFETPAAAAALAGMMGLVNTPGNADIEMPDTASLSVYHQINADWALMADITWMHWAVLDELRVKFANGAADSVTTFNWEDTWRFAVGAVYTLDDQWTLRGGLASDPTPVPDALHRTPRVPDTDRIWLSLGTSYQLSKQIGVDFGYTYISAEDASINKPAAGEDLVRGALNLDVEGSSHIFGVQLSWNF